MGMVVQHNMNATNAYNRLNANVAGLKKASEKLSSGYRINRAGDDAAGLAISEKMRSQIKGLNQATRNAQDGINMIQTFEGAAQETHSILQRMKELATESANGTYDNQTDRAAIQLEFDQLNDELNQIADTDFNGTIVLNGGVMADGLKAEDNEFNYKVQHDANPLASAKDVTTYKYETTTGQPDEAAGKIIDNSRYSKTDADSVWQKLGLDVKDVTDVDVTFTFDGNNWIATAATNLKDKNGNAVDAKVTNSNLKNMTTTNVDGTDSVTGKGGFKVDGTTVNAIFDSTGSNKYDHLTIHFQNIDADTHAPANAGVLEGTLKDTNGDASYDLNKTKIEFTLDSGITDETMTADIRDALKKFGDLTIKTAIAAGNGTFTAVTAAANGDIGIAADGTVTVKGIGDAGADLTLGKLSAEVVSRQEIIEGGTAAVAASLTSAKDGTGADITAIKFDATDAGVPTTDTTLVWDNGAGNWKVNGTADATLNSKTAINGKFGLSNAAAGDIDDGTTIIIKAGTPATPGTPTGTFKDAADPNASATELEFQINTNAYSYVDASQIKAESVATSAAAKPTTGSLQGGAGVTNADAYGNSTAILTYTDNITLQTGARTKDAVNFSFAYNTDGTADMGDLKANLDLSSRANGLNTANLSLANQKDANYAIDQIDKAINKTSMVRATFGSIQNRLEHKITNLTTTNENLTEAESSIRDTDMASEMMNYTKFNILQQAAQSMLAQANQQPQSVLQLLG